MFFLSSFNRSCSSGVRTIGLPPLCLSTSAFNLTAIACRRSISRYCTRTAQSTSRCFNHPNMTCSLCCLSIIVAKQPTQLLPTLDLTINLADFVTRFDDLIFESLVVSLSVVMIKVSGDGPP